MERKSIDVRCLFTPQERADIFAKSKNRCCHCGCKLTQTNSSIEHVIPLDKGGTNDFSNLVALCISCNSDKSNYIYHPLGYYRYLQDEYLNELVDNQNKYYKEFTWLSKTNFIPEDMKVLSMPIVLQNGKVLRKGSKIHNQGIEFIVRKGNMTDDFDAVYNYIKQYNEKYYTEDEALSPKDLNERITQYFKTGCLYIVETKSHEIKGIIPICVLMSLEDIVDRIGDIKAEREGIGAVFYVENVICYYNTDAIGNMMLRALRYIFSSLGKLHFTDNNLVNIALRLNLTTAIGKSLASCIYSDAVSVTVSEELNENREVRGAVYFMTLAFNDDIEYDFLRNFDFVDKIRGDFCIDWNKRFTKGLIEKFNGRYRGFGNSTKEKKVTVKSSSDLNGNIITCYLEDLKPSSSCPKNTTISTFRRKQFKDSCLPPIRIRQNMKVRKDSYDTYLLLKEKGVKKYKCEVTGEITIDLDLINADSDKYDKSFIESLEMTSETELSVNHTQVEEAVVDFGDRCGICGRLFTETDDDMKKPVNTFIVPMWRGGSAKKNNKVVCHKICSVLKGRLTLTDDVKSVICNELASSKFFETE